MLLWEGGARRIAAQGQETDNLLPSSLLPLSYPHTLTMPPKEKASKKAVEKEKAKIIEDKTFGLKNKNKSKKVEKYIKSVQSQVANKGLDKVIMLFNKVMPPFSHSIYAESRSNSAAKESMW